MVADKLRRNAEGGKLFWFDPELKTIFKAKFDSSSNPYRSGADMIQTVWRY